MSIAVMTAVWSRSDLDPHEKLVLLALADHANDEGECYPSVGHLALKTSMSDRGVRKVVRRLEERGFIVTKTNGGRKGSNHFKLHLPEGPEDRTPEPGSPLNHVPPEPGSPHPGTPFRGTPEPGSPEPSKNRQEPCARAEARERVAKPGRGGQQGAPSDWQRDWLAMLAEKLKQGAYVAPSSLRPDQARRMRDLGLVEEDDLRRAGIAF